MDSASSLGSHVCAKLIQSCPTLSNPRPVVHRTPLFMGFSRPEYWNGLPRPSPGDLPDPGVEPASLNVSCLGRRVLYHSRHLERPQVPILMGKRTRALPATRLAAQVSLVSFTMYPVMCSSHFWVTRYNAFSKWILLWRIKTVRDPDPCSNIEIKNQTYKS